MKLSETTHGLEGSSLEAVRLQGESLDDLRQFWNESARVNAMGAVAQDDTDDTIDESGATELIGFGEFLHPDASVVEIGCGIGRIIQHVAPLCHDVTGFDVSSEMVRIATERLRPLDNVTLHVGNGYDLHEVADDSIDLVYSNFVFQHCPKPITYNYLLEANRVLRPGGWLWFHVPNLLLLDQFHAFHHFAQPEFAVRPYPMYFFTPAEVTGLLLRAGFRVERMNENVDVWGTKNDPEVAPDVQDLIVSSGELVPTWVEGRAHDHARIDELEKANAELEREVVALNDSLRATTEDADGLRARVLTLEDRFPNPQYRRLKGSRLVRGLRNTLRRS